MRYSNPQLDSGFGRILNADRSKSVNVFYVLRTAEVTTGGDLNPLPVPDLPEVVEMRFRAEDRSKEIEEPEWLRQESIFEDKNGKSYRIERNTRLGEIRLLKVC